MGLGTVTKRQALLIGLTGFIAGILVGLACQHFAMPMLGFLGRPKVTLMNATGEDISKVTISLGSASEHIPYLGNGRAIAVKISGHFSETSTRISWADSTGMHAESAHDYMEDYGSYHAKIVLTPDRKATAVYEMRGPSVR
jgi:hypothetical protein